MDGANDDQNIEEVNNIEDGTILCGLTNMYIYIYIYILRIVQYN